MFIYNETILVDNIVVLDIVKYCVVRMINYNELSFLIKYRIILAVYLRFLSHRKSTTRIGGSILLAFRNVSRTQSLSENQDEKKSEHLHGSCVLVAYIQTISTLTHTIHSIHQF